MDGRRRDVPRSPGRFHRRQGRGFPTVLVLGICALRPTFADADEGDGTAPLTITSDETGLRIWVLDGPHAWPRSPASPAMPAFLCSTPCALDLPSGDWQLRAGESHEFPASLGVLPQHWVVADDRLWMRNLAVFFDVFGAAMFGLVGPILIGLGAGTDGASLLTAGIVSTAVGGALLLAGIPLWILWPGGAERVDSGAGVATDRVGSW